MNPVSEAARTAVAPVLGPGAPRARLHDVAREAGVSLATVDRVLHQRPGVSAGTLQRVHRALERLSESQASGAAMRRDALLCFVLPPDDNGFVRLLREELVRLEPWLLAQGARLDIRTVDGFAPAAAASALKALRGQYDAIVLMAPDHPLVRDAVDRTAADGTCVISLVSRITSRQRTHFVGIDNAEAGRMAAGLLANHTVARTGRVGVLIGSRDMQDHAARTAGFVERMARDCPGLQVLNPVECLDRDDVSRARTRELLSGHADLVALYSAGAGNRGIREAIQAEGAAGRLAWVCHELTDPTREALQDGSACAVISQPAAEEARTCCRLALDQLARQPLGPRRPMAVRVYTKQDLA